MKVNLYISFFIGLSLFAFSCNSVNKFYENGNYEEAVDFAAKKLQKNPNDPKLLNIIKNAYQHAITDHESRIHNYTNSKDELKYEWIYNEYVSLQKINESIDKVPSAQAVVKPVNYNNYLLTYSQKASDIRFNRGIALMQQETKKGYQDAYGEFQIALQFNPGNSDATKKSEEAYKLSVTNVVILSIQKNGSINYSSYNIGGNNFDDQVIRHLQNKSGSQFVKFYSALEARNSEIRIDEEIDLRVGAIDIGNYYDNPVSRHISNEILVRETFYKADSIVREYARVNATVTTTTRTMNSSIELLVNIRNSDGMVLWNDNINTKHKWTSEFSTFIGDERVLSASDKQQLFRRQEKTPTQSEIMRILVGNIENELFNRIKKHYNGI